MAKLYICLQGMQQAQEISSIEKGHIIVGIA